MLLLDEITVDLDVLGRADLLNYLKEETETRKASIIYVGPPSPLSQNTPRIRHEPHLPVSHCKHSPPEFRVERQMKPLSSHPGRPGVKYLMCRPLTFSTAWKTGPRTSCTWQEAVSESSSLPPTSRSSRRAACSSWSRGEWLQLTIFVPFFINTQCINSTCLALNALAQGTKSGT